MKLGISRVLPPFESCDSMRNRSNGNDLGSNLAQEEKTIFGSLNKSNVGFVREEETMKVGNDLLIDKVVSQVSKCIGLLSLSSIRHDHEEQSGLNSNNVLHSMATEVHPSNIGPTFNHNTDQYVSEVQATKNLRSKQKRRKGKPKKRSMVDICAEARPCTLDDLDRISGSNWADHSQSLVTVKGENVVNEVNESMVTVDRNYSFMEAKRFWKAKHPRDENSNNSNLLDKRRCLMKIKLNGCKFKPRKLKTSSLT